nr:immunoglobulin light chain junction region [Macaca mulatta]MOW10235.1 immunoglobulin light chain junction region [Macaca mulatta]MOW10961.1 immunoglobulin light chain junction region [Macaca mulatta]
CQQFYSVPHNF